MRKSRWSGTSVRQLERSIIVTGDIAFGGKAKEYTHAGEWLDRLAKAVGCPPTAVKLVPGNHDIDRDRISASCGYLIDEIIKGGEAKLNAFLKNEDDQRALYVDCGLPSVRTRVPMPTANNRWYRQRLARGARPWPMDPVLRVKFGADLFTQKTRKGSSSWGAAQRVLPTEPGVELVVLCHHPLPWLQDSDDARKYVRSRARVFNSWSRTRAKAQNRRGRRRLRSPDAGVWGDGSA